MNKYSTAKTLVNVAFCVAYLMCIIVGGIVSGSPMMAFPAILAALIFVGHMTIHAAFDIAINTARQVEQNDELIRLVRDVRDAGGEK